MVHIQKIYGTGQKSFNTLRPSVPQGLRNTSFFIHVCIPGANPLFCLSLDTSPILVYPVLMTAGKVTSHFLLFLSPVGSQHKNLFLHLRLEGWMGQGEAGSKWAWCNGAVKQTHNQIRSQRPAKATHSSKPSSHSSLPPSSTEQIGLCFSLVWG